MTTFPIDEFKNIETPFYYYDMELLRLTLDEVKKQAGGSKVHYAVKANANPRILAAVREAAGAAVPFDILPAVWVTSLCSVTAGLLTGKCLARVWR